MNNRTQSPASPLAKENNMDKKYMALLWNEKESHDIQEFETLREAVEYLVKHGAKFERQEIVTKVDWMPASEQTVVAAPTHVMTSEEQELAKRPNPTTPAPGQPTVIDPLKGTNLEGKHSIFDGIIPPQMRGALAKDD
jgi:hypothetical protein